MKDYMTIYKEWLENPYFDEATKEELRAIEGDENEIKERFYMDLEFGTAGLRGIIGAGINRMNIYTVRRATQGLANYIIKQGGAAKGVAIARRRSFPLPSASLAASPASTSPPATTRRSTTATRFTGRTAHSLHRRMTRA